MQVGLIQRLWVVEHKQVVMVQRLWVHGTEASGRYSTAMGLQTTASVKGNFISTAMGYGTQANGGCFNCYGV